MASVSLTDQLESQEQLPYPYMAVTQPLFSSDGRYAMVGFTWSFMPYRWYEDHCLYENAEGHWGIVECAFHPLP